MFFGPNHGFPTLGGERHEVRMLDRNGAPVIEMHDEGMKRTGIQVSFESFGRHEVKLTRHPNGGKADNPLSPFPS